MKLFASRYRIVSIQGFLSGLPFAAITNALQAQYIEANASLFLIGCLSLLGQIYLFKFLLAPLSDSIRPPFLNQKSNFNQGWIKLNQLALITTLLIMGVLSAQKTPLLLIFFAFLTTVFSAFQDVNIDSYRIQLLNSSEISQGSTYYLLGFRIGMLFSGGLSIVIGNKINWHIAYIFLAGLMLIGSLMTWKNETIDNKMKKNNNFLQIFFSACKDLKNRPFIMSVIAFVLLYGIGDAFTVNVNSVFLIRQMHFSLVELAFYSNTLNIGMIMISTIIASYFFKKFNLIHCLVIFSGVQIVMLFLYFLLAETGPHKILAIIAILSEGLDSGLIATAIIVVISSITRSPYTTTQYAILSALAALKNVVLGPVAAIIVKNLSWQDLYFIGILLSVPGTYLAWNLHKILGNPNFDNPKILVLEK
jgi:PAT family beta-lactamase induction signal transducer AmpG